MDLMTLGGIALAVAAILGGQALEGGHAGSLLQLTAFMIVFGGTVGAVMVSMPKDDLLRGLKLAKQAFAPPKVDVEALLRTILELAGTARRDGVLALEGRLAQLEDPFLQKALRFVVDGVDTQVVRESLDAQIDAELEESLVGAKVFEAAGGYSPTLGILGAVLGLIHVMENLSDPSKLGPGIAVAFVATVYGVGMANLLFLPLAAKMKRLFAKEKERKILIAEAALGIQEGLNPRILEEKLRAYLGGHPAPSDKASQPSPAAQPEVSQ